MSSTHNRNYLLPPLGPPPVPPPPLQPTILSKPASDIANALNSKDNCYICFDALTKATVTVTPCGHVQCRDCITKTIAVRARCPVCRFEPIPWIFGLLPGEGEEEYEHEDGEWDDEEEDGEEGATEDEDGDGAANGIAIRVPGMPQLGLNEMTFPDGRVVMEVTEVPAVPTADTGSRAGRPDVQDEAEVMQTVQAVYTAMMAAVRTVPSAASEAVRIAGGIADDADRRAEQTEAVMAAFLNNVQGLSPHMVGVVTERLRIAGLDTRGIRRWGDMPDREAGGDGSEDDDEESVPEVDELTGRSTRAIRGRDLGNGYRASLRPFNGRSGESLIVDELTGQQLVVDELTGNSMRLEDYRGETAARADDLSTIINRPNGEHLVVDELTGQHLVVDELTGNAMRLENYTGDMVASLERLAQDSGSNMDESSDSDSDSDSDGTVSEDGSDGDDADDENGEDEGDE
ncbi:hypothetical protein K402DRAFT_462668 [Aulographum hederae CBS 113979]|uniref:RING-type domain-containing protein n=1 Tax=Aulographum hederae CBS 113979 TaxID=1176131 RepID=A0A6G1H4C6_9PEZI|nr:hypothetical protein K402DRAFT_462668 [Aulographum hederae CBS 113979]